MTKNPITISPDSTISEVLDLMAQKNVHRLPVVQGDTLIGLLTEGVIQENSPSHASSLSIHEINYLLSKTMVKDIMIRKVITIGPDALLEEAALLMKKNEIGGLPVVVGNKLVGIITVNDILGAFVDLLGFYQPGSRVVIEVSNDRSGIMADLASIFAEANINISHLAIYHRDDVVDVVVRCNSVDKYGLRVILESKNYKVISVL